MMHGQQNIKKNRSFIFFMSLKICIITEDFQSKNKLLTEERKKGNMVKARCCKMFVSIKLCGFFRLTLACFVPYDGKRRIQTRTVLSFGTVK
jgi:hypothetical protein